MSFYFSSFWSLSYCIGIDHHLNCYRYTTCSELYWIHQTFWIHWRSSRKWLVSWRREAQWFCLPCASHTSGFLCSHFGSASFRNIGSKDFCGGWRRCSVWGTEEDDSSVKHPKCHSAIHSTCIATLLKKCRGCCDHCDKWIGKWWVEYSIRFSILLDLIEFDL